MIGDVGTFTRMLHDALAPITLISGIGLLMVCMTARFIHATNRIRQLVKKRATDQVRFEPYIDKEIHLIYKRIRLLRQGTLLLALSGLFSAILVTANILQTFLGLSLDNFCALMLVIAVALIVVSCLLFSLEVRISLYALSLAVESVKAFTPNTKTTQQGS